MAYKYSEQIFADLSAETFRLIDLSKRLPLYCGLDGKGRYCLAYESSRKAERLMGTGILDISSYSLKEGRFRTMLSLRDNDYKSVFFSMCDDVILALDGISDNESGYRVFIERIGKWKKMLASKSKLLSKEVIQGLYGELYFLDNYLFQKHGFVDAVKAWGGPQGMPKDFSIGLDWYEVKCISATKEMVQISSMTQLESENPGALVVIKTETTPAGFDNGVSTINALFSKITKELSKYPDALDLFLDCIEKREYQPEPEYDEFRFHVVSMTQYQVDERFPRIKISEEFSDCFGKIIYEMNITALKQFEKEDF